MFNLLFAHLREITRLICCTELKEGAENVAGQNHQIRPGAVQITH
jgi:hypothetical protein